MDESFNLLSSMSPKISKSTKTVKKTPTVLALKNHFRRSSIFDKQKPTIPNKNLKLVESSSTSSFSGDNKKDKNGSVIIISDSDDEQNVLETPKVSCKKSFKIPINENVLLPKTKMDEIEQWIDKVNNCQKNTSYFTEVSSIYHEEMDRNNVGTAYAVNSTFNDLATTRFDELFKNDIKQEIPEINNLVIEDSFENKCEITNVNKKNKECENKINVDLSSGICNEPNDNGYLKILDDIYGQQWRDKIDLILPNSEPRKNIKTSLQDRLLQTERRTKHKNPYTDSERKQSRLKINEESPWLDRLKHICDSDTDSEQKFNPKKQLFPCDHANSSKRVTSPYFKSCLKSNTDKDSKCSSNESIGESNTNSGETRMQNIKSNKSFEFKTPPKLSLEDRIRNGILKEKQLQKTTNVNSKNDFKDDKTLNSESKVKTINSKLNTDKENLPTKTAAKCNQKKKNFVDSDTDEDIFQTKKPYSDNSSEEEWNLEAENIRKSVYKPRVGTKSFLESLSPSVPLNEIDASARIFRNNFKQYKVQLTEKLFNIFNKEIFDNAIPAKTKIEWNDRMRGTAGYCRCKKITHKTGMIERTVQIELSTKVLDSADRLRDTLIHEMCHAATWLVNHVSDGHGQFWKTWAFKAMTTFPELPPIKRCHEYAINTKYKYRCVKCGYSIGRHTKSLDVERKRCGYCLGTFEVLINKVSKNGDKKLVPVTPRKEPNGFALFVKENYGSYRTPNSKHGDVMKLLGQKFAELKVQNMK